jgi:hypothetical protein
VAALGKTSAQRAVRSYLLYPRSAGWSTGAGNPIADQRAPAQKKLRKMTVTRLSENLKLSPERAKRSSLVVLQKGKNRLESW